MSREYVHAADCSWAIGESDQCSCGLDAVLLERVAVAALAQHVTHWAVRRIDDGEITETHRVGLYAPETSYTEGDARRFADYMPGYEAVHRTVITITEAWH